MDATLDFVPFNAVREEPAVWSRRGVAEKMAWFETLDSPCLIENSSWPNNVSASPPEILVAEGSLSPPQI